MTPSDPTSDVLVQHTCYGQPATIVITAAGLTTNGTEELDVIVGSSGNDIVNGLGGDDRICGNGGKDRLNGDDDSDWLHCGRRGADDSYDWDPEVAFGGTLPSRDETDVLLPNSYCELEFDVP